MTYALRSQYGKRHTLMYGFLAPILHVIWQNKGGGGSRRAENETFLDNDNEILCATRLFWHISQAATSRAFTGAVFLPLPRMQLQDE